MREFQERQVKTYKCTFCGSLNKLYADLLIYGEDHGNIMRCCNCGHVDTFLDFSTELQNIFNGKTKVYNKKCIRPKYCKFTECPYYNTADGEVVDPIRTTKKIDNRKLLNEQLSVKSKEPKKFL